MKTNGCRILIKTIATMLVGCGLALSSARADTHYVSRVGANIAPYATEANAAREILDAVSASSDGDTVQIDDGTYFLNTVSVTAVDSIVIRSKNGLGKTIIDGTNYKYTCVNLHGTMTRPITMEGVIIQNGTEGLFGTYCHLLNCIIQSNSSLGAELHHSTVSHCSFMNNHSQIFSGGLIAYDCEVEDSSWLRNDGKAGGGAYFSDSTIIRCRFEDNAALDYGGGVFCANSSISECQILNNFANTNAGGLALQFGSIARNCLIAGNAAGKSIGGADVEEDSIMENCTVTENRAAISAGGIQTFESFVTNTIIYFNDAPVDKNYTLAGPVGPILDSCCTTPLPPLGQNIDTDPQFIDRATGNYHLLHNKSPCVDHGLNAPWMQGATDLDGNPRIIDGTVDMGAYESDCRGFNIQPNMFPNGVGGIAYRQILTAAGGVAPFTFWIANGQLPPGVPLVQNGGVWSLAGTPQAIGVFTFTLTASDTWGCEVSQVFTLTIDCQKISLQDLPDALLGVPYNQPIAVIGGVPPYQFKVDANLLPPGLALNANGALLGTSTKAGRYSFTVEVTDSFGCKGTRTYTMTICPEITIHPDLLANGVVDAAYSQTITASGGVAPYQFAMVKGNVPGLALDANGTLAGTPTKTGSYRFDVEVTDAFGCKGMATVRADIVCPRIYVQPNQLPNGVAGAAYLQTVTANGGVAPYQFAVINGTPPPGLKLDVNGRLAGTPTQGGKYCFTVEATDAWGCAGTRDYCLSICSDIKLQDMPNGMVGVRYFQPITVFGGIPEYTFAVNGVLPPGVNYDPAKKEISGIPVQPGIFKFTLLATDSLGCMGSKNYAITILAKGSPHVQFNPQVAPDGQGGIISVWEEYRNGSWDIYAQRVTAKGALLWGAGYDGLAICTAPGDQRFPKIVPYDDNNGQGNNGDGIGTGVIMVWTDLRNKTLGTQYQTYQLENSDIYAQKVRADGVTRWGQNGVVVCNADAQDYNPQMIAPALDGSVVIAWQEKYGMYGTPLKDQDFMAPNGTALLGFGATKYKILAQRLDSYGQPQMVQNGVSLTSLLGQKDDVHLATDDNRGAIVTWVQEMPANSRIYKIYAQRVENNGFLTWANMVKNLGQGMPVCSAAGNQTYPRIAKDGAGGAIIAWQDARNGATDIYANRIDKTGVINANFNLNGTLICGAAGNQMNPEISGNGLGGAIIVWQDWRNNQDANIYAQRINGAGKPEWAWAPEGAVVSAATGNQVLPKITGWSGNDAFIAWQDTRNGTTDIYAQYMTSTGVAEWNETGRAPMGAKDANGLAICRAAGVTYAPQLTWDNLSSSLYMVWPAIRSGAVDPDIYAQRTDWQGNIPWITPAGDKNGFLIAQ